MTSEELNKALYEAHEASEAKRDAFELYLARLRPNGLTQGQERNLWTCFTAGFNAGMRYQQGKERTGEI